MNEVNISMLAVAAASMWGLIDPMKPIAILPAALDKADEVIADLTEMQRAYVIATPAVMPISDSASLSHKRLMHRGKLTPCGELVQRVLMSPDDFLRYRDTI